MTDLVERLRERADKIQAIRNTDNEDLAELLNEAATTIEQQRDLDGSLVG